MIINGITVSDSAKNGEWFSGRQYWDGTLSEPGQINSKSNQQGAGQQVSNEVVSQTNPNNVQYIQQQQQLPANQIQSPVNLSLPSGSSNTTQQLSGLQGVADTARSTLNATLEKQKLEVDAKLADLKKQESETLGKMENLTTPFREELEKTKSESLYINKNFEENQKLVDELDTLLTEGNNLIKQQSEVTGLASIRNPRIQQTMQDVAARAGVIQAVMSARNSQISVAQNMIDRTATAIAGDRSDQLNYYSTVLQLQHEGVLNLDKQSQTIAQEQVDLLKADADRANATVDYVKQLLINPDSASLMAEAGISLNDSVENINAKLQRAISTREVTKMANEITSKGGQLVVSPNGVPKDQLVSFKGPDGQTYYYQMPKSTTGTSTTMNLNTATSEMTQKIVSRLNSYGDISPADWQMALQSWLAAGFNYQDFVKNFGKYADTNRGDFVKAYGFSNPEQ